MWWLEQIILGLTSVRDWFLTAYYEVSGWVYPFNNLASPLLYLYGAFYDIVYYFSFFNVWVSDVIAKVATILSYADIWSLFTSYFTAAINAWNWVLNSGVSIENVVNSWWFSTSLTVQSWISSASQWLQSQIDSLTSRVATIQAFIDELELEFPDVAEIIAWFSDWWTKILSPLTSWWNERLLEVNTLVESILRSWFPFYDTLVELWDRIAAFFVNPLDWLLDKFTDWFLGPEA